MVGPLQVSCRSPDPSRESQEFCMASGRSMKRLEWPLDNAFWVEVSDLRKPHGYLTSVSN